MLHGQRVEVLSLGATRAVTLQVAELLWEFPSQVLREQGLSQGHDVIKYLHEVSVSHLLWGRLFKVILTPWCIRGAEVSVPGYQS